MDGRGLGRESATEAHQKGEMTQDEQGGQVSETAAGAGEQEAPGDAVAAHPDDSEDSRTEEGTQGPDAPAESGRPPGQDDAGR
jgi:hypothetical protein